MPDAWWKLNKDEGSSAQEQPSVASTTQQPSKTKWAGLYCPAASRITTRNELRLRGAIACVLQLVVTITLASVLAAKFYSHDSRLDPLPIVTWATTAVTAGLGLSAFLFLHPLLLELHAMLALCGGAALGALLTAAFLMVQRSCDLDQYSFSGCAACPCAATSNCTRSQLAIIPCDTCAAWGTDVCKDNSAGVLPYMGFLQLLFICMPAVFSLRLFVRLETVQSELDSRLTYGRMVVASELERLTLDLDGPRPPPVLLWRMLLLLLRYGSRTDVAAAHTCCGALGWSKEVLEAGGGDWVPEGGAESASGFFASTVALKAPSNATSTTTSATSTNPVVFSASSRRLRPGPTLEVWPEGDETDTNIATAATTTTAARLTSPSGGSSGGPHRSTATTSGPEEQLSLLEAPRGGVGQPGKTDSAVGPLTTPLSSSSSLPRTRTAELAWWERTSRRRLSAAETRPPSTITTIGVRAAATGPEAATLNAAAAAEAYRSSTAVYSAGNQDVQLAANTTSTVVQTSPAVRTTEIEPIPLNRTSPAGRTSRAGVFARFFSTSKKASATTADAKMLPLSPPAAVAPSSVSSGLPGLPPSINPIAANAPGPKPPNSTTPLPTPNAIMPTPDLTSTTTTTNTPATTALVKKSASQTPPQIMSYNPTAAGPGTAAAADGALAAEKSMGRSTPRAHTSVAAAGPPNEASGMGTARKPSSTDAATKPGSDALVSYSRTQDVRSSYNVVQNEQTTYRTEDEHEMVTVFVSPPTSPSRERVKKGGKNEGQDEQEAAEAETDDGKEERGVSYNVTVRPQPVEGVVAPAIRRGSDTAIAATAGGEGNVITSLGSRRDLPIATTTSSASPSPPLPPPPQAAMLNLVRIPRGQANSRDDSLRSSALKGRGTEFISAAAGVRGPPPDVATGGGGKGLAGPTTATTAATAWGGAAAGAGAGAGRVGMGPAVEFPLPGAATASPPTRALREGFSGTAVKAGPFGAWGREIVDVAQPPQPPSTESQLQQMPTTEPLLARFKAPRRLKRNQDGQSLGGFGFL